MEKLNINICFNKKWPWYSINKLIFLASNQKALIPPEIQRLGKVLFSFPQIPFQKMVFVGWWLSLTVTINKTLDLVNTNDNCESANIIYFELWNIQ